MTRATRIPTLTDSANNPRDHREESSSDPIIVSVANQAIPEYLQSQVSQHDMMLEEGEPKRLPLFTQNLKKPFGENPTKKATSISGSSGGAGNSATSNLTLPTCFNLKTKSQWAELEPSNLQVSYSGLGKGGDIDSATVKGNHPIPPACGIYYFEVKIINKGRDGYIGVGFTSSTATQQRLPGLDENSWGYHASDGKKYNASNTGVIYGPTFSTGDLIGCCINFSDLSISFTRNGIMLGVAWKGLHILEQAPIYPVVGLRTPGEVVVANFGLEPFRFDIGQYYRDEKLRLTRSALCAVSPSQSIPSTATVNSLIVEYLVRQGYHETAVTFYNTSIKQLDELDETGKTLADFPGSSSIEKRKQIFCLISEGRVQAAMKMINQLYPSFSLRFPLVYVQLQCLKFVEIVRDVSPPPPLSTSADVEMMTADHSSMDIDHGQLDNTPLSILDAIKLSQDLKSELGAESPQVLVDAIDEIICLICYQNPYNSPLSYILDLGVRGRVGELVNASILDLEGWSLECRLEKLYRQVLVVDEIMSEKRSGSRTLLSLQQFLWQGV